MTLLPWLVAVPAPLGLVAGALRTPRAVLRMCITGSVLMALLTGVAAVPALRERQLSLGGQLMLDPLSGFHAMVVVGVFVFASFYARHYFAPAVASGSFDRAKANRFGFLWFLFLGSMLLTLVSNNLGLMWVGMEATTIASALLVCLDRKPPAVRAAWTYLVMCSVAIALALLGIIVLCAEAGTIAARGSSVFLWSQITELGPLLEPGPVRLAFLLALVGYGTKAGLAPMHSWLPEAHGQAPTPVSAVLSGVLLNCALYCLSRFVPIVESSSPGWANGVLVPFGVISLGVAAAFIAREHDVKRLLAFHSVEHMGIITLGLGFGAPAAALFHTLNHSVCKMLTFFCAGALAQRYGTSDMHRMKGSLRALPLAGGGFLIALLALIGTPPFSVFMSELWIARAGINGGHWVATVLFIAATTIVFIAAFRHAAGMTWPATEGATAPQGPTPGLGWALVAAPLALLLVLGLVMPPSFSALLGRAGAIVAGTP